MPEFEFSPNTTYLVPLHQGLIEIKGPDAATFLQGQVTCDVRELDDNTSRLGAQCNIKGRMLLSFRAVQLGSDRIVLRVHKELVTSGLGTLGKYIVFSKAKLADVTQNYRCVGIAGPEAAQIVQDVFTASLTNNDDCQTINNHTIIRIDAERYECWIALVDAENLLHKLGELAISASQNLWDLLNIQAGIGDITPHTFETFTPQAINFQLINGINFRKGCYTGQEIVARLHYRGTLKRHMFRFSFPLDGRALPIPGTELKNADGKTVGEVVLSAYKSANAGELLASVIDDERVAIYLENNPQKLSLLALPYAIPTPNDAD